MVPTISLALGAQLAPILAAYWGDGAPERYFALQSMEMDVPNTVAEFVNVYEANGTGVFLHTSNQDALLRDISTFDAYSAWQTSLGETVVPMDVPGFTWSVTQTKPDGRVSTIYMLVAGDRLMWIEVNGRGDPFTGATIPIDIPVATETAVAIRDSICG
jgi:hypothetical protein